MGYQQAHSLHHPTPWQPIGGEVSIVYLLHGGIAASTSERHSARFCARWCAEAGRDSLVKRLPQRYIAMSVLDDQAFSSSQLSGPLKHDDGPGRSMLCIHVQRGGKTRRLAHPASDNGGFLVLLRISKLGTCSVAYVWYLSIAICGNRTFISEPNCTSTIPACSRSSFMVWRLWPWPWALKRWSAFLIIGVWDVSWTSVGLSWFLIKNYSDTLLYTINIHITHGWTHLLHSDWSSVLCPKLSCHFSIMHWILPSYQAERWSVSASLCCCCCYCLTDQLWVLNAYARRKEEVLCKCHSVFSKL